MGMLIDFYTGDATAIVAAWHRNDLDALRPPGIVTAHADLSLHVAEDDLDVLVRCACELSSRPALTFSECVRGARPADFYVLVLPIFGIAWLLSPRLRADRRAGKAKAAAAEARPPPPEDGPQEAVAALVETCRTAAAQQRTVLYVWSL
jgi:hypothetical protein